jgi:hypothetical protein
MIPDHGRSNMPKELYVTTEEFAQLLVDYLHEYTYFKKGETYHPEDLSLAMTTAAQAMAYGMGYVYIKNMVE